MIDTLEEHERLLTIAEGLMDRGPALSREERKLLELLVLLIQTFENSVAEVEEQDDDQEDTRNTPLPQPHETLQRLMQSRRWEHDALLDIFGNPHSAAEVLAGRRPISKGQAKALAKLFRVPVKLFVK